MSAGLDLDPFLSIRVHFPTLVGWGGTQAARPHHAMPHHATPRHALSCLGVVLREDIVIRLATEAASIEGDAAHLGFLHARLTP